jgi:hypothetical protein
MCGSGALVPQVCAYTRIQVGLARGGVQVRVPAGPTNLFVLSEQAGPGTQSPASSSAHCVKPLQGCGRYALDVRQLIYSDSFSLSGKGVRRLPFS